jgi:hypothetical protein
MSLVSKSPKPPYKSSTPLMEHMGQLPFITLQDLKILSEQYSVQFNFIFKPNQIRLKVISINPITGLQIKSQSEIINNFDIPDRLTIDAINRLIRNVTTQVY